MQYLHFLRTENRDHLTARADSPLLEVVSRDVLKATAAREAAATPQARRPVKTGRHHRTLSGDRNRPARRNRTGTNPGSAHVKPLGVGKDLDGFLDLLVSLETHWIGGFIPELRRDNLGPELTGDVFAVLGFLQDFIDLLDGRNFSFGSLPNEILEDLILSGVKQAIEKGKSVQAEEMQKITGGLGLPPGMGL